MSFQPTDEQRAILDHDPNSHARILAGPGTGKSTTMVALLDQLLRKDPSIRVRMLTFTRAAAAELAEKLPGDTISVPRPSTVHSFAISVLLRNRGAGGFPEPLRIADSWEEKEVVRPTLARRMSVGVRELDRLVREMAANWESLTEQVDPSIPAETRTRFLGAWNEHRSVLGYTILAELPFALRRALHEHEDIEGLDYDLLLVDEYQDLNACDLEAIGLVSERSGCSVIGTGDDDQSIYSWRMAAPEGIRRFMDDYDRARDYSLSVTLRCGRRIIEWANHVIEGDPDRPSDRVSLDPLPSSPDGEVALLRFDTEQSEAEGIADLIDRLISEEGLAPNEILVLMRTDNNGTFSKSIREELENRDVTCSDPDSVSRALAEPSNREALELLRLLVDADDSISWASLLELQHGIGSSFFDYVYDRAKSAGSTFAAELHRAKAEGFPDAPRSARLADKLLDTVCNWLAATEVSDEMPSGGWGQWICDLSGTGPVPQICDELEGILLELDGVDDEPQGLARYLARIEPIGKDLAQAKSDGVRLMRMGGSKGLTVRAAILAGVENELVPRPGCDPSEERRVLYVAMTRAKEFTFCTWARRRSGPTARAGAPSMGRRRYTHFLEGGPVVSVAGRDYLSQKWPHSAPH